MGPRTYAPLRLGATCRAGRRRPLESSGLFSRERSSRMNTRWVAIAIAVTLLGCSGPNQGSEKSGATAEKAQPAAEPAKAAAAPAAPAAGSDKAKITEAIKRYYT